MTLRPSFQNKQRPSSAIFIGSNPPPTYIPDLPLPDLPEPPSPGATSNGSGLPSPPATNSTGSGSTGDNNDTGSIRQRPESMDTLNGANIKTFHTAFQHNTSRNLRGDDEDDENDNDEDNTARLDRRNSLKGSTENAIALQRVKSLNQRNRMVLDKLSSISRLSTPSPGLSSRNARSPAPQSASASSSSSSSHSSSRISNRSHTRSASHANPSPQPTSSQPRPRTHHGFNQPDQLSGSETERESHPYSSGSRSNSYSSSSDDVSFTPPTSISRAYTPNGIRPRRTSAPSSPAKVLGRSRTSIPGRASPPGSSRSRTPRKRASMAASTGDLDREYDVDGAQDVTRAALAAVASSRRSPTGSGGRRTRQPLPREFRRGSPDRDGRYSVEPVTPHRDKSAMAVRGSSPSPRASTSNPTLHSPRATRANRSSTVRELARRHQTRWMSEDFTQSTSGDPDGEEEEERVGRRQGQRGGSAESALVAGGRSLVGEGLRAAGIMRRDGDDVFGNETSRRVTAKVEWADTSAEGLDLRPRDRERSLSRARGPLHSRISEGVGPPQFADGQTPDTRHNHTTSFDHHRAARDRDGYSEPRAATSMADYRYNEEEEGSGRATAPVLRTYKSAISDRAGTLSALGRNQDDERYPSPFGNRRYLPVAPLAVAKAEQHPQAPSEHTRLLVESLAMFESHLGRLPASGSGSNSSAELYRSAQGIVQAAEKLNGMLRSSTNRALEAQIDAEVNSSESGVELAELWRRTGSEFRESMRVSDELVRGMTGFLLGVGKVIRESTSGDGGGAHGRSVSLDDAGDIRGGRMSSSPDPGGSGSGSGRRSAESRRSWEPLPRDDATRRLSGRLEGLARPPSVLNTLRDRGYDDAPQPALRNTNAATSTSVRRLFTPREQREQQLNASANQNGGMASFDSQETLHGYDPSPTPASRQQPHPGRNSTQVTTQLNRSRTLPPLPPPLPSLPSESLVQRHKTTTDADRGGRHKPASLSISTVRPLPKFPAISTQNPTTALTPHTVSNSPTAAFPLTRSDSDRSTRTNVTFSRPSTVSVSALSGLQQRDSGKRGAGMADAGGSVSAATPITPLSGSETERDIRRGTTVGRGARASLDRTLQADRGLSRESPTMPLGAGRRERRRTINEIFSGSS